MDLTQANYNAWAVKPEDFPKNGPLSEQLKFLLRYGILAPSAHNTQPWYFDIKDNVIEIYINKKRILGASDPTGRQTYESMGACIENLVIAANYFNFHVQVNYSFGKEDDERKLVAIVAVSLSTSSIRPPLASLLPFVPKRHSAKLAYHRDRLSEDQKKGLMSANEWPDLELKIIDDSYIIGKIAYLVGEGTRRAMQWPEFLEELRNWLKPNWTKEYEGMPGFTVGMPGFVSWLFPKLLGKIDVSRMQEKMMQKLVRKTPAIGIISVYSQGPMAWMNAGRLFERISLLVTKDGFGTSAMGAPVEFNDIARKLKIILQISGCPTLVFRIGRPKVNVGHSPRHL
ncbi:MAG: hypothetical protein HYV42_03225 [Candidatus Magasanikbacteria bacterium]|nr:hypothetical protein [Candidatus Magasanikbacteria bacterium]